MNSVSLTSYPQIEIDHHGIPRFAGTRFKITHVIIDHVHWKWSPEAIQLQHPQLTLGQIHSALAYYFDHREMIEAELARQDAEIEELRRNQGDLALSKKLRAIADERLGI